MKRPQRRQPASLTLQIDTTVPAVFVLLGDPSKMRFSKSVRIVPGIVVNLDRKGNLLAVELIGPVDLDFVISEVAHRFDAPALVQLETRRHILEEVLASSA
jgi:hypothetical protein